MDRTIARKTSGGRGAMLGLLALATIQGCAHVRPTQTGYLSDYSRMAPARVKLHDKGGFQRDLLTPPTPDGLAGIDSFHVEPIAWLVDPGKSASRNVDLQGRVVASFDKDLREKLGSIRPLVETPGPGTALVRAAVTEVVQARPVINALLAVTAVPLANGGGTFEVEVIGPDRRQIVAVSSSSSGGALELVGYFSRSRQAADAARRAASETRAALAPGMARSRPARASGQADDPSRGLTNNPAGPTSGEPSSRRD